MLADLQAAALPILFEAGEVHAAVFDTLVEGFVRFAEGAHIAVELVHLGADVITRQLGQLERIHAADARAVFVAVRVAAAHAVQDGDALRGAAILTAHCAVGRPAGVDQTLQFHAGQHVVQLAITVLRQAAGVKVMEAGGQDDGADLDIQELLGLLEVDGAGLAEFLAGPAFAFLEVGAVLRGNDRDARHGLREGEVNGRAAAQAQVELREVLFPGALFDTGAAAGTQVFVDVARLAAHPNGEIANIALDRLDLAVAQEGDVWVASHGHHLGGENSGRTV